MNTNSFKKSSPLWRPFCSRLIMLMITRQVNPNDHDQVVLDRHMNLIDLVEWLTHLDTKQSNAIEMAGFIT